MKPIHLNLAIGVAAFSGATAARMQLSLFALSLGAQPSQVGLLFATHFVFPLLMAWPIGVMADRIGSRGLLMFGMAAGAIGLSIPWAFPNLYALYAAGLMSGLAFAFSSVLILNLAGLLSTPENRARNFANTSMTGSTANVLGPLIAGFAIDHAGQQVASLCSAGLLVVAFVLLAVWGGVLPGGSAKRAESKKSSLRDRLSDRTAAGIILVSCLVQTGSDLFVFYLPIYGHSLEMSATTIGIILASIFAASFVSRLVMPQLILRVGERNLLAFGLFAAAAGFALIPLFEHPVMLSLIAAGFGLGSGCAQPLTMMLLFNRAPEGRSGETVALRQTANNITRVISPPFFGAIAAATGLWGVFLLSALLMGAGGWKVMGTGLGDKAGKA